MKPGADSPRKTSVGTRRRYAAEFKRRLVRMSLVPGASAAKIALKHELNANLLFKWRRRYLREISGTAAEPVKLLPVTVRECTEVSEPPPVETVKNARSLRRSRSGAIEIELPQARIRVMGTVDSELLRTVVQMLRGR
jgi:transposase